MDKETAVFQSLEVIERRISEKLTVESIANAVYFSKYHYQRLFREIVGDSVMDYVTRRKLSLAGRALFETNASIIDIALDFGYDSREGFTRSFKTYMGVSPGEYRKYGLTTISQKKVKEWRTMTYSKSTDAIIRELNEWIAKIKDLAGNVRKTGEGENKPFWENVAEYTEDFSESVKAELDRISTICIQPDEITGSYSVIKLLDDINFQMHLLGFQVAISEARLSAETNLAEKYRELAWLGHEKTIKIAGLFRELSTLIINDMWKTAAEMMQNAIERGRAAAESLPGNATYIKDEVLRIVDEMVSTKVESMSKLMLSDLTFKLEIISLTAKLNVLPMTTTMVENMDAFKAALVEATEFCRSIIKPDSEEPPECKITKMLQDVAFQGNILLFYTRGEIENLCMDEKRKPEFAKIEKKIDRYIKLAHEAERGADITVFKRISDIAHELVSDLDDAALLLGTRGDALKVISIEHKKLAEKASGCIKDFETLESK